MMTYHYPAKIIRQGQQLELTFVDFRGVFNGTELECLLKEAKEYLTNAIGNILQQGRELPSPRSRENLDNVRNGWYEYIAVSEKDVEIATHSPRMDKVTFFRKISPRVVASLQYEKKLAAQRLREQQQNSLIIDVKESLSLFKKIAEPVNPLSISTPRFPELDETPQLITELKEIKTPSQ